MYDEEWGRWSNNNNDGVDDDDITTWSVLRESDVTTAGGEWEGRGKEFLQYNNINMAWLPPKTTDKERE